MAGNSDFSALLKVRRAAADVQPVDQEPDHSVTQSPDQAPTQLITQAPAEEPAKVATAAMAAARRRGKSQNPDYDRLTVYLRRETILDLNRRKVEEGRELSEIVQEAVEFWLASRPRQ